MPQTTHSQIALVTNFWEIFYIPVNSVCASQKKNKLNSEKRKHFQIPGCHLTGNNHTLCL